jgi:hypothetical protein
MSRSRRLVALAAGVLTMGATTPAGAAPTAPAREGRKAPAAKAKVLKLEEMKVEGRIQKPQAMFLMPRANLNVGELDHAEPLLPRITEAAEKDPL